MQPKTHMLTINHQTHCYYSLIIYQNHWHFCVPTACAWIQAQLPCPSSKPLHGIKISIATSILVLQSFSMLLARDILQKYKYNHKHSVLNTQQLLPLGLRWNEIFLTRCLWCFKSGSYLRLKLHHLPLLDWHFLPQSLWTFSSLWHILNYLHHLQALETPKTTVTLPLGHSSSISLNFPFSRKP